MATAYYPEYLFLDENLKTGAYSSFLHEDMASSFNEAGGHHESYTDATADHIDDPNNISYPVSFDYEQQTDLGSSLLATLNGYGQHHHIGYPIMAHYDQEHTNSSYYYSTPRHVDMKQYDRRPLNLHIDTHSHSYLHAEQSELVPPVLSPTQLGYPESASDPDDTSSEGSAEPHEYYSPDLQDISDMPHVSVDLASPISVPDQLSVSDSNLFEVLSHHPFYSLLTSLNNTSKASRSISGDTRSSPFLSYLESLTQRAFHDLEHDTSMHPYDSIIRTRILAILENLLEITNKSRVRLHSQEDDGSCVADADIDYSSPTPSPTMATITPDTLAYSAIKEESDSDDADDDEECHSGDSDTPRSPSPVLHKRIKRELPKDEDDDEEDDTEGSSCEHASKKRKTRENYDRKTTKVLMDWFLIHDGVSPNQKAKDELSKATGKTPAQIATWYQNARRRYQQKLQRFRQLHTHNPAAVYDFESFDAYVKGKESEPCRKRNKGKPDNKNA
ncbi:hypothetical protein BC937DRAFT_94326 [Endogone sp. FLAS-F59071]|nr:hypothetical protein BC937DRAFT_94326 [Endogone sp. FLAS-F59071]|eukprot:RUS14116.1 hypothetical protein BC937DRAFT_94326 [Endogone sp. FLAS-F59071]